MSSVNTMMVFDVRGIRGQHQQAGVGMVGTTRSRVYFFLNKFRELGFIDYNGGLTIDSSLLSVVLHD